MKKDSFEDKMQQLEKVVVELEKGDMNLDESLVKFEDGMKLAKECNKMLEDAEYSRQIGKITHDAMPLLETAEAKFSEALESTWGKVALLNVIETYYDALKEYEEILGY